MRTLIKRTAEEKERGRRAVRYTVQEEKGGDEGEKGGTARYARRRWILGAGRNHVILGLSTWTK